MDIIDLALDARNSISKYCIEECKAYCCKKGFLILDIEEINLLVGDNESSLKSLGYIRLLKDKKYSLNLSNHLGSCPSLKDNKCTIHDNSLRPNTCKDFPIFIIGDTIKLSKRCYAVRDNKLYPHVHKFIELGYKIE